MWIEGFVFSLVIAFTSVWLLKVIETGTWLPSFDRGTVAALIVLAVLAAFVVPPMARRGWW
jgi:hypothetical protein